MPALASSTAFSIRLAEIVEDSCGILCFRRPVDGGDNSFLQDEPFFRRGGDLRCERARLAVFIQIIEKIKLDRAERDDILQGEIKLLVDRRRKDLRRQRQPEDLCVRKGCFQFVEKRRGADDIADRSQFNDEDLFVDRIVVGTIPAIAVNAMHPMLFVRFAGDISTKETTVGLERNHQELYDPSALR